MSCMACEELTEQLFEWMNHTYCTLDESEETAHCVQYKYTNKCSFLHHRHTSFLFLFAFCHSFVSFMLQWIRTYEYLCSTMCLKQQREWELSHALCRTCVFKAYFPHYKISNALMRFSFDSLVSVFFSLYSHPVLCKLWVHIIFLHSLSVQMQKCTVKRMWRYLVLNIKCFFCLVGVSMHLIYLIKRWLKLGKFRK